MGGASDAGGFGSGSLWKTGKTQFELKYGRRYDSSIAGDLEKATELQNNVNAGNPLPQDYNSSTPVESTTTSKTGASTSSAPSVSQASSTSNQGSVGAIDTTTRRGTGQIGSVVGLLSTIQKSLLGM